MIYSPSFFVPIGHTKVKGQANILYYEKNLHFGSIPSVESSIKLVISPYKPRSLIMSLFNSDKLILVCIDNWYR